MLNGLDHPSNFSIQGFVGLSTCKNCLTAVQNRKNCKIRCSPGNTDQHFLFLAECTSPHILQEQHHGSHYNSHKHYHCCTGNCKSCSMWLVCSQFITIAVQATTANLALCGWSAPSSLPLLYRQQLQILLYVAGLLPVHWKLSHCIQIQWFNVYVIIIPIFHFMNEAMSRLLMMLLAVATTLSWHCAQDDKSCTMHLHHSVMRVF